MADNKKYYWLKLKRDFFKRHDIRIIESMPNGKDYILFYLKLLLESIDHEGELRFSDTIPYNEAMLATITDTNIDIVRAAMKLFLELNMIELFDDQTIFMSEVQKMIGSESKSAARVRKHRESQKALQCNSDVTKSNIEIESEKEKEKELEKQSVSHSSKAANDGRADRVIDNSVISDIKNQIEFDFLTSSIDADDLELAVSIIAEMYAASLPQQFNGMTYSAPFVQRRSMQFRREHVELAFEKFYAQREKIQNTRRYLAALLFNAVDEIGCHYSNAIRVDGAVL